MVIGSNNFFQFWILTAEYKENLGLILVLKMKLIIFKMKTGVKIKCSYTNMKNSCENISGKLSVFSGNIFIFFFNVRFSFYPMPSSISSSSELSYSLFDWVFPFFEITLRFNCDISGTYGSSTESSSEISSSISWWNLFLSAAQNLRQKKRHYILILNNYRNHSTNFLREEVNNFSKIHSKWIIKI